ncbi:MAG: hypothetical protein KKG59_07100 [Nanoarchaeota archaeon]|nr:hypothetical protein [Nanoarchaeota archaeon]
MALNIWNWNVGLDWTIKKIHPNYWKYFKEVGHHMHKNNFQDRDIPIVSEAIGQVNPDVVFLHELDRPAQLEALAQTIENEHSVLYMTWVSDQYEDNYSGALIRPDLPFEAHNYSVRSGAIVGETGFPAPTVGNKSVIVLDLDKIVLASVKLTAGPLWGLLGVRQSEAVQMVNHLTAYVRSKPHAIIADMNLLQRAGGTFLIPQDKTLYRCITQGWGYQDAAGFPGQPTHVNGKYRFDFAFTHGLKSDVAAAPIAIQGLAERYMDHNPLQVTFDSL